MGVYFHFQSIKTVLKCLTILLQSKAKDKDICLCNKYFPRFLFIAAGTFFCLFYLSYDLK